METRASPKIACPDCGQEFSTRGLSGHRRLRHLVSPPPALPRDSSRSPDSTPAILAAITGLQDAVCQLAERVTTLQRPPAPRETAVQEAARLERELAELLQHLVRIKQTGLAATAIRRPASEAQESATLELARLRRDQARLVFRLEELRHGTPSDERFLV